MHSLHFDLGACSIHASASRECSSLISRLSLQAVRSVSIRPRDSASHRSNEPPTQLFCATTQTGSVTFMLLLPHHSRLRHSVDRFPSLTSPRTGEKSLAVYSRNEIKQVHGTPTSILLTTEYPRSLDRSGNPTQTCADLFFNMDPLHRYSSLNFLADGQYCRS